MTDETMIKKAAEAYFAGKSTVEEEAMLSDFVTGNAAHKGMFREWEREWLAEHVPDEETVEGWHEVQRSVRNRYLRSRDMAMAKGNKVVRINRYLLLGAAAVLAIVCLLGVKFLDVTVKTDQTPVFTIQTQEGEQSRVTLPDGTSVWLNASTTLSYDGNFNRKDRVMQLSGEAYFDVGKNPEKPFVVNMPHCTFEVKGTRFNLTAYDSENTVSAVLMEGAMEFASARERLTMQVGHELTYNIKTGEVKNLPVRAEQYKSWMYGNFEYDRITMRELLTRLARQYKVDIVYRPLPGDEPVFSVSLKNGETVDDVLDALSLIVPLERHRENGMIMIRLLDQGPK